MRWSIVAPSVLLLLGTASSITMMAGGADAEKSRRAAPVGSAVATASEDFHSPMRSHTLRASRHEEKISVVLKDKKIHNPSLTIPQGKPPRYAHPEPKEDLVRPMKQKREQIDQDKVPRNDLQNTVECDISTVVGRASCRPDEYCVRDETFGSSLGGYCTTVRVNGADNIKAASRNLDEAQRQKKIHEVSHHPEPGHDIVQQKVIMEEGEECDYIIDERVKDQIDSRTCATGLFCKRDHGNVGVCMELLNVILDAEAMPRNKKAAIAEERKTIDDLVKKVVRVEDSDLSISRERRQLSSSSTPKLSRLATAGIIVVSSLVWWLL